VHTNQQLPLPPPAFGHGHAVSSLPGAPESGSPAERTGLIVEICVLCFALALLFLRVIPHFHDLVGDLAISFVGILLEALPFMLLGSVVGGLIEEFLPHEFVTRTLSTRKRPAIFVAAALGLVFPVCECAVVPVVRRLLNKGVPMGAAVAFLLGAPILNPIVATSTWLAYRLDWNMVLVRMLCGYLIAVGTALLMNRFMRTDTALLPDSCASSQPQCFCCDGTDHASDAHGLGQRFFSALGHASNDFFDVAKYLVIGAFVAALARTTIDVEMWRHLSASPVTAILLMMALAVALSLCSEVDAFVAAGFRGLLPNTAQMAFMLLGPMLDIKLLLMYQTIFRRRAIVTIAVITTVAVFLAMVAYEFGLGGLNVSG